MDWSSGMRLRVVEGSALGQVFELNSKQVSVGRTTPGLAPAGFIHVDDDTVSRLHAELQWNEILKTFTLVNHSSTNPTKVNDTQQILFDLKPGDSVRMGECVCVFESNSVVIATPSADSIPSSISLTSRPPLSLIRGDGERIPFRGLVAALGGPPEPDEKPLTAKDRWFDQEILIDQPGVPPRFLNLTWRDLSESFELSRHGSSSYPVEVHRLRGGLTWAAELPAHGSATLRHEDVLALGGARFQIVVG